MVISTRRPPAAWRVKTEDAPAPFSFDRTSELATAFLGVIRVYQATLSTQDADVCNFHPSCSRFGSAIGREVGTVRGLLLTADRLARDHGLPALGRHYEFDRTRQKFLDPIERYRALVNPDTRTAAAPAGRPHDE